MKFLVDAQLPVQLARFLSSAGHDALHTTELPDGNRTTDGRIVELADEEGRVVVTKDRNAAVVCFAHVTNTMATSGHDFEKGVDAGVHDALAVAAAAARALTRTQLWSEPAVGSR